MRSTRAGLLALVAAGVLAVSACSAAPAPSSPPTAAPSPAPSTPAPPTAAEWAAERLDGMSLEQKAASLLMLHAPGTDPAPLRDLAGQGLAGLILMGDNIPDDPAALAALTGAVQSDPEARTLIGIDEEGGDVQRIPWDPAPGADALRGGSAADATAAFRTRGEVLAAAGVDVNFGIVADVTDDPDSFIFDRVLGTDAANASPLVAAAVQGEHGLVGSTLKHFPGHGQAPGDSHESLPTSPLDLAQWRAIAAPPFQAGIDAGSEFVMTGHLVFPAVDAAPASLSTEWHRILREELGFEGVVVTDDMLMLQHNGLADYQDPGENVVRAVAAGSDLLLYVLPEDPSEFGISVDGLTRAIADAVRSGRIPEARVDDAALRVLTLRRELTIG
ncbi:glycoside hydrolase family 3 N-terminal domain-containing protein [Agromyces mediolanus]|uniref:glycoside hydrolase family 3 N-terminal domain-containing protein n=1 Tax=Agromyces mediolanus TaxID=41986 RepID=UPI001E4A7381|nr:glycoside hydrolase family 3 N-terminal domain-containing protein [Agromyces mediolanus]MCD1570228.1 glycoside hydrolase family 3 protein [Agromyces mediolanus]